MYIIPHNSKPMTNTKKAKYLELLNIATDTITIVKKSIKTEVIIFVIICCNASILFILDTISPTGRTSKNFNGSLNIF